MNLGSLRRRRIRDSLADAPVFETEDGQRAILLPHSFVRGVVIPGGNAAVDERGVLYALDIEDLASLAVQAIGHPASMSERGVAVVRKMLSDEEWNQAGWVVAHARRIAEADA